LEFYNQINNSSRRKRKEHLRTTGMGGIRNARMQMFSNARGKIRAFSFLHVPIPTALRTSLSSSSLLTLSKALIVEPFRSAYIWWPSMYLAL